jgi:hypothetical protein
MKITYTGQHNQRVVSTLDLHNYEETDPDVEFREWVWVPGGWVDVPDEVAKELIERSREFVPYEDPRKRDHRTKEELYAVAQELDIAGRSTMDREELFDAVTARQSESSGGSEAQQDLPIEVQSDTPDRAPEAEDQS